LSSSAPRVSIGLPVFNGENYIREALESILAQTFSDFEVIISDTASEDKTPEICQAYASRDGRFRYHRYEHNPGAAENFNRVFELSRGEYFKWAAHDDLIAPDFLLRCINVLDNHRDIVLCHPKARLIDESGRVVADYDVQLRTGSPRPCTRFHDLVWVRHWCLQAYGLIRRKALEMTDLHGQYASSDRVLLIQLALLGPFHEIPEYLFFSRSHGERGSMLVKDLHAYAAWYDPTKKGKLVLPASTLASEHLRAVAGAPLGVSEKACCCLSGLLRLFKFSTILARDITVPIGQMLRRYISRT